MRPARLITIFTLLSLLLGGVVALTPRPAAAQGEACFQETGFCVRGRFLDYWTANGGLARNGFPLTDERQELLEDGNTYTVQYFERVRLEYHPENAAPYNVLLGQFGRRILEERTAQTIASPAQPLPGQGYFAETGHNLGGDFLAYWQANGGLAQFGFPLTEVVAEQLEDGTTHQVQYFERARFEDHPENGDPAYRVLLGQFGRRILLANNLLGVPAGEDIGAVYVTTPALPARLGAPSVSAIEATGAYQAFERGAMLYVGGTGLNFIYVLCGDPQAGQLVRNPADRARDFLAGVTFPDPYQAGQPTGGGPGPRPGLYEPRLGFGTLWRENPAVRDCLGYATSPEETTGPLRLRVFGRGALLSVAAPDGRVVYAIYRDLAADSGCALGTNPTDPCPHRYSRYPSPTR